MCRINAQMNNNPASCRCGVIVLKDSRVLFFMNWGVSSVENPHPSDLWITPTHIVFTHRINAQVGTVRYFFLWTVVSVPWKTPTCQIRGSPPPPVMGNRTCHHGCRFSWVRVWVTHFAPMDYPCPSLVGWATALHGRSEFESLFDHAN